MRSPEVFRGQGDLLAAREDSGFTLIELLVVIIIIGILAAIAIPVYLNQRARAFDSAMKSDIHTLAQFEEAYLVDHPTYGTVSDLTGAAFDVRVSKSVTLTLRVDGSAGYCISATHPSGSGTWYYDSQNGGLQPRDTSCAVTSGGSAGGSVTG